MTKRPPNILWICTDQQRFDTIRALGNPYIHTPNLDRLAASGVAFTHVYCQNPICTPSRSSFMTGLYPSGLRQCINGNEFPAGVAPLIGKVLADAGYCCGLAGKLHLASIFNGPEHRFEDGYGFFRYSHAPNGTVWQGNQFIMWLEGKGLKLSDVMIMDPLGSGLMSRHRPNISPDLHHTTWCGLQAQEFIEDMSSLEQPWMLSAHFFAPHPAWDPPAEYRRRYDASALPPPYFKPGDIEHQLRLGKAVDFPGYPKAPDAPAQGLRAEYYAMIELVDDRVGKILDTLEATGQRDRTLIIFTSDHGEMLGDHGLFYKGCRLYEGAVRVPLIMSGLPSIRAGLRATGLVELVDLVPTILEIAGLPAPLLTQGRSLVPLLSGVADPAEHRDTAWSEYFDAVDMKSYGPHSYPYHHSRATMIRDARYKLISYHGTGLAELFDLENDPWEFENLWDRKEHRETRERLSIAGFDRLASSINLGTRRIGRY